LDANAVAALQRLRTVGQEVTLKQNIHACSNRTLSDSGTDAIFGFAENENLASFSLPPSPTRRKRSYRPILPDQRTDDTEPLLNIAKLDESSTGRENQFRMRCEPNHLFSADRKAIPRIEECSVDIAEHGNSRQRTGL
jgi:hypothetical protein